MKNKVSIATSPSIFKSISNTFRVNLMLAMVCLLLGKTIVNAQVPQVSKSPLMGWASWNNYSVNINDSIIRAQADAMVSSGLATAGYNYINIDDGFFNGRYANGAFRTDTVKFPNGMKGVADYIHSKGLKAGIYSDAGSNTCGSIYNNQKGGTGAGLYLHDQQDANLFFNTWGYDYVKVDYCGSLVAKQDEKTRYTAIKNALDNTGKDYNFNICRWQFPGSWVTSVGEFLENLYRYLQCLE